MVAIAPSGGLLDWRYFKLGFQPEF